MLIDLGAQNLKDHIQKCRKNFIKSKISDPKEPLTNVNKLCEINSRKKFDIPRHAIESLCNATKCRIQTIRGNSKSK